LTPTLWQPPPSNLSLGPGQVHIWRVALNQTRPIRDRLQKTLTADEYNRANRFHFAADRARFVTARGVLRLLLGQYLELAAQEIRFDYTAFGKPVLPGGNLVFNLSHADDLALLAFTLNRGVGVDVERVRPEVLNEAIAQEFFSAAEVAALQALPPADQPAAFFAGWTRKEAYIKARGQGLSIPLDSFDVSLTPGQPARLLASREDPAEPARWSLVELFPGPGYAAALAVEGHTYQPDYWQFEPDMIDNLP
jgi:4'-phosphopantetheinyl transferase